MFGSSPPPPPKPQKPAPMPDPEDPAILAAKRRSAMEALSRGGRQSTILTSPDNRGSTSDYSRKTLGGS